LATNKRTTTKQTVLIAIVVLLISLTLEVTGIAPITTKIGFWEDKGASQWSAHYFLFSGSLQRNTSTGEGSHNLEVKINTESGIIRLAIIGTDGTVFYSGNNIPTSSFVISVKDNVSVHVDAQSHRGSFSIKW